MSTKIYDAYITREPLGAIHRTLSRLRQRVMTHSKTTAGLYVTADGSAPFLERSYQWRMSACRYVFDILRGFRGTPGESCAVLYAHPRQQDTSIVQFFNVPGHILRPAFRTLRCKDFHYQNQTDPDENITAAEWRDRRRTWDRILKEYDTPNMAGFTFELCRKEDALFHAWHLAQGEINKDPENPAERKPDAHGVAFYVSHEIKDARGRQFATVKTFLESTFPEDQRKRAAEELSKL